MRSVQKLPEVKFLKIINSLFYRKQFYLDLRSVQKLPEVKFKKNKFIGLSKTILSVLALGPETSRS